jgi:hypothetical protein
MNNITKNSVSFLIINTVIRIPGLGNRKYGREDPSRRPHDTVYLQKLALTKVLQFLLLTSHCVMSLFCCEYALCEVKLNSVALVRERTIPTERPPLVGEVSAYFCG